MKTVLVGPRGSCWVLLARGCSWLLLAVPGCWLTLGPPASSWIAEAPQDFLFDSPRPPGSLWVDYWNLVVKQDFWMAHVFRFWEAVDLHTVRFPEGGSEHAMYTRHMRNIQAQAVVPLTCAAHQTLTYRSMIHIRLK